MELLLDVLIVAAGSLGYVSLLQRVRKSEEGQDAKFRTEREERKRLYEKNARRFADHIQGRMHGGK